MDKGSRITGADIAEYLGITPATVSRALSGHPRISAKTRQRVCEAAKKLGYISNATARTLVQGRSNIIGILSGGLHVERTGLELIALDAELRKHGLLPFILYTRSETESIVDGARKLIERDVDGFLVIGCSPGAAHEWRYEALCRQRPTFFVDPPLLTHDVPTVCSDYQEPYRAAADILAGRCRTHVHALVKRSDGLGVWGHLDSCLNGITSLLKRFDCRGNMHIVAARGPSVLYDHSDLRQEYAEAIESFLASDPQCDAIICNDDDLAILAMGLLAQRGKRIPQDVSILGFGNMLVGELVTPQLSSIARQPMLVAQKAVECLLKRIGNPNTGMVSGMVPGKLVNRQTL